MSSTNEPTTGDFRAYEAKWLRIWSERPPAQFDIARTDRASKFYNLVEFPYPSAEGLHVGHVYTYCGADALGRYLTMNGKQVFQPMGFDSFGIHTENYALKIGEHPKAVTDRTTANYRKQLGRVGANWAWDTELRTDDPAYYRWTQWIFLQLFKAGLAEKREAPVIWCPSCQTVLAFEQVEGNRCERCDTVVVHKTMKQWFLRITAYADQLLDSLDGLDWPELSKRLQREWMGRSKGADVVFTVAGAPEVELTAFTTRVDTLFGVSFVALAPEHEYVKTLIERASNGAEVAEYVAEVAQRVGSDRYTNIGHADKPGVVTDVMAVHPITGEKVPMVVADYVLAGYGTGVVMGVPAHDDRDYTFAEALGLPITTVIKPAEGADTDAGRAFTEDGVLVASGEFSGMTSATAREAIASALEAGGRGRPVTRYRLQDWLVSRQRYWGSPIPIIFCEDCGTVPVPESDLPVELPVAAEIRPTGTGESPLAAVPEFVNTTCPKCGGEATRETDVFDTFVESSWYFLRYPSHDYTEGPWDPDVTARMLPVDMYAGGREHATRHHLYARFVTRALHDLGHLPFPEPFARLRLHGLLIKDGAKMSKSRGNVVNPDEYIDRVGADALRTYLLFCGPWEEGGDFSDRGLQGVVRFNGRLNELIRQDAADGQGADMRRIDRAIHKIGKDIERLKFNTAIAEIMSLSSWLRDERVNMTPAQWNGARRTMVRLIAPFEPFLAEELWEFLGEEYSVHRQPWPRYDPDALFDAEVELPVQVNGKPRGTVVVPADAGEDEVRAAAVKVGSVAAALAGATPRRVVYIPRKIVNLVV